MLSEEDYWARLALEAKNMETEEPSFQPVQGDLRRWQGFILGTGIYDKGVCRVCVGILGKEWLPSMSLTGIVETIRNLLNFPNPDDPLNQQASRQAKRQPMKFEQTARDWVQRHAGWDQIQRR